MAYSRENFTFTFTTTRSLADIKVNDFPFLSFVYLSPSISRSYFLSLFQFLYGFNNCTTNPAMYDTLNVNHLKTKLEVLFYQMLPDFLQSIAFWKVLRLRPFVLSVRTTCR